MMSKGKGSNGLREWQVSETWIGLGRVVKIGLLVDQENRPQTVELRVYRGTPGNSSARLQRGEGLRVPVRYLAQKASVCDVEKGVQMLQDRPA